MEQRSKQPLHQPQYIALLEQATVRISIDGKRWPLDNIFTVQLWRTDKYEEVDLHSYTSLRAARQELTRYLDFHNHGRLHQALAYRTLAGVYFPSPCIDPLRRGKTPKVSIRSTQPKEQPP